jgi:hypothetical protein
LFHAELLLGEQKSLQGDAGARVSIVNPLLLLLLPLFLYAELLLGE